MKRFQCPDREKPDNEKTEMEKEAEKTVVVANVHLHYAVANNNSNLRQKDDALKQFYDTLAELIMEYKVRLVNGDFNMDTIRAISELRARGLCVNVSAWYPWFKNGGDFHEQEKCLGNPQVQLDSVVIMVVGPNSGVRLPFDLSVYFPNEQQSAVAECCKQLYRHITDEAGHLVR